jgi:O-methyltransferase involved in polyketide biosynthesis
MQQIQSDDLKGVSKTLLIPLHYYVEESKSESSSFKDEVAERFHDAIAYDWAKFDTDSSQNWVTAVSAAVISRRRTIIDEQVGNFLKDAPDGLVVNLGAGLNTRFHRLDNGRIEWIELDLPGVIAFRQRLHEPECKRHRMIAASVLDDGWVAEIKRYTRSRILFVAEGLFPYFTEEEHRKIFTCLAGNFPGQEMLFHTLAPSLIQDLAQYSLVSRLSMKVEMQWGLDDSKQVSALNPKVEFVDEFPLLDKCYDQLPEPIRQKLSPAMARQMMRIVHVRFREQAH